METTLNGLVNALGEEYLVISISFEGIGDKVFQDEEETKYNSPWNIAVDFNVEMRIAHKLFLIKY